MLFVYSFSYLSISCLGVNNNFRIIWNDDISTVLSLGLLYIKRYSFDLNPEISSGAWDCFCSSVLSADFLKQINSFECSDKTGYAYLTLKKAPKTEQASTSLFLKWDKLPLCQIPPYIINNGTAQTNLV